MRPITAGPGDPQTWTRAHRRALDAIESDPCTIDAAIECEIDRLARLSTDDPAECWRAMDRYDISTESIRIRIHGESMPYGRAVLELAAMVRRQDDPDAIRCVESDIRAALVRAFERSTVLREAAEANVERDWGLL